MLLRSLRKWAISVFSFSVRGLGSGIWVSWGGVSRTSEGGIGIGGGGGVGTGYKGVGLGLSRSSSGSQGRSTPPIL